MTTAAIVGRPNVGKSALFNRLLRKRIAIVHEASGTTRDRLYGEVDWNGRRFIIIDTGGVELDTKDQLKKEILEQIKVSIKEADLVIFVTDATTGVVPMDKEIAGLLRQSGKDVIVAVNKADNDKLADNVYAFSSLGWDKLVAISAMHGLGVDKLLDMVPAGRVRGPASDTDMMMKAAVIGRPNVGKSTFVNTVLDQPRMLVSETPGTTRDAVDIRFTRKGREWLFIDTAGIRKAGRVKSPLEYYSVRRAYRSIDRSDVVILMVDGWEGIRKQDVQLLDYIAEKLRLCIIAVNKWDLVKVTRREYRERIADRLGGYWYVPAEFVSSLKKEGIEKLLDKVEELFEQSRKKIQTGVLNRVLHKLSVKIDYGTQVKTSPPTFLLFVRDIPKKSDINYIRNQLHKAFGLEVPIRLQFRAKKYGKI